MFKLLRNFFSPNTLYQTSSELSGDISVVQKGKERQLLVNNVRQSINWDAPGIEDRYWGVVSQTALRLGKLSAESNVLLLGLGGGTVAQLLSREVSGIEIDGVEVDSKIVDIAENFFGLEQISSLRVLNCDGLDLVSFPTKHDIQNKSYDFILSDVYCGGKFPKEFAQENFIEAVYKLLSADGLAIFNRAFTWDNKKDLRTFAERIRTVFGNLEQKKIPVSRGIGNLLLIARRR